MHICTKQWEDRYVFNLKEADGFVYRNYILVLNLHSFLYSFHSGTQTVYMVCFPDITLNPGQKDFSKEVCVGNPPDEWSVGRAGGNLKIETVSISMGCLAAALKQGLLLMLQMSTCFLMCWRKWCPWVWDIPQLLTSCVYSLYFFKVNKTFQHSFSSQLWLLEQAVPTRALCGFLFPAVPLLSCSTRKLQDCWHCPARALP